MSDFIAQSRFLAGMSTPDMQALLARATPRRFRPNSVVTHQGAPATETHNHLIWREIEQK